MRLAAGHRPDPLGELEHSPRRPSRNWGVPTSKGEGREGEKGRKGVGRGREEGRERREREKGKKGMGKEEGKGRGGREGGRLAPHTIFRP